MNRAGLLAFALGLAAITGCGKSPAQDEGLGEEVLDFPIAGLTLAEGCPKCGGPLRPIPVQDQSADAESEAVRRGEALPAIPDANPWASICDTCQIVRPRLRGGWQRAPLKLRVQPGEQRVDNGLSMSFRWCPPGTYLRGSSPEEFGHARNENAVQATLTRGFWMGEFEVTQAQWKTVMGSTLREQRSKRGAIRPLGDGSTRDHCGEGPDYPIYFVSHADAMEFCRALNKAEGSAGRLPPGYEYTLPTEAQWEYACRAGTTTATPYGNTLASTDANFDGSRPYNAGHRGHDVISFKMINDDPPPATSKTAVEKGPFLKETTPVGSYKANAWGIHDMLGNVAEWCRDGYTEKLGDGLDPVGPESSPDRVFRGGCWYDVGPFCRSAGLRNYMKPDGGGSGLGFRVALVAVGR